MNEAKTPWTYHENGKGRQGTGGYVIRSRGRVVGEVKSKGDADLICRVGREAMRESTRAAFEARLHRIEIARLKEDVQLLIKSLARARDAMKSQKNRDVTASRENITKVLRRMKTRGFI